MQASFMELVGTADALAASVALASAERQELGRELSGLTPTIDTANTPGGTALEASHAARSGYACLGISDRSEEASAAAQTSYSCVAPIFINDGDDLTHEASEAGRTGWACATMITTTSIAPEGEADLAHEASEQTFSGLPPACVNDAGLAHQASDTAVTGSACASLMGSCKVEAAEASHAAFTTISACVCMQR